LDSADPISSDPEALKQQARNNRVSFLWTEWIIAFYWTFSCWVDSFVYFLYGS
jgi:hypothetical protein